VSQNFSYDCPVVLPPEMVARMQRGKSISQFALCQALNSVKKHRSCVISITVYEADKKALLAE
jgi:hypothetical protein